MKDYHNDPVNETRESFDKLIKENNELINEIEMEKNGGSATKKLDRMLGLN